MNEQILGHSMKVRILSYAGIESYLTKNCTLCSVFLH